MGGKAVAYCFVMDVMITFHVSVIKSPNPRNPSQLVALRIVVNMIAVTCARQRFVYARKFTRLRNEVLPRRYALFVGSSTPSFSSFSSQSPVSS